MISFPKQFVFSNPAYVQFPYKKNNTVLHIKMSKRGYRVQQQTGIQEAADGDTQKQALRRQAATLWLWLSSQNDRNCPKSLALSSGPYPFHPYIMH